MRAAANAIALMMIRVILGNFWFVCCSTVVVKVFASGMFTTPELAALGLVARGVHKL
jgi:hypothetical protein